MYMMRFVFIKTPFVKTGGDFIKTDERCVLIRSKAAYSHK